MQVFPVFCLPVLMIEFMNLQKNRDEFVAKLEELREQVLGSEDK